MESAHNQDFITFSPVDHTLRTLAGDPNFGNASWFVLTDSNTYRYCLPLISEVLPENAKVLMMGDGERCKDLDSCHYLWRQLLDAGADRKAILINLGGGVVCDLGGFAASVYKRGIRFIHIPTTLLSMVDASIGGKTGIDLDDLKNMIGLFSFPEKIIIDTAFLESLPEKEFRNGLVEIYKHGLIADPLLREHLHRLILSQHGGSLKEALKTEIPSLIRTSINIKTSITNADPFEKGDRKFLNLGHTIGHALETYSLGHDDLPLSHGQAVSVGLVCEAWLSVKLLGLSPEIMNEIKECMRALFPDIVIRREAFSPLQQLLVADKKSDRGETVFVLLKDIGQPVIHRYISDDLIRESILFYSS